MLALLKKFWTDLKIGPKLKSFGVDPGLDSGISERMFSTAVRLKKNIWCDIKEKHKMFSWNITN